MHETFTLPALPLEERIGDGRTAPTSVVRTWTREVVANGCDICLQTAMENEHAAHRTVPYVTWGGGFGELPATWSLGISASPLGHRGYFRRALFDLAYGYVNGFPASAILYFLLTRCLPPKRIRKRIMRWEAERRHAVEAG